MVTARLIQRGHQACTFHPSLLLLLALLLKRSLLTVPFHSSYAFTIISTPSPTLIHRRLFAFASGRCPDGIKCDTLGNVYAGCLDGISLWNPQGDLLGKILIPGGVANFCFVKGAGEVLACGETRLWSIRLGEDVRGALLG